MAAMAPTFCFHLESTGDGPSWWATSDDVPGLSAAAGSLEELRERVRAVLVEEGIGDGTFHEMLAGAEQTPHRIVVSV
jgi:hypothetical protein